MFKGMKKVLAGLLAAAIALTPVSSVMAATKSPVVTLGPVTKHGNTPYTAKAKEMMQTVNTTNRGNALVTKVNPNATSVTFTDVKVKNGKYYYVNDKGKKVVVNKNKRGVVTYKIGAVKTGAFLNAVKVQSVTLGSKFSAGHLDYKCFAGAHSLKKIYIKARKINNVNKNLFGNNVDASKIVVYVPGATTSAQFNRFVKQFTRAGVLAKNVRRSSNF